MRYCEIEDIRKLLRCDVDYPIEAYIIDLGKQKLDPASFEDEE